MTQSKHTNVAFKFAEADGVRVFYREAGAPDAPVLLLCTASQAHRTSSGI